jgi:sugar phosphate isomerase/epimerase
MSARLLSLASGVLPEFTPETTAAAAIAAGWPAVGIMVDPATWTGATASEVRARTADAGVAVLDVEVIWLQLGRDNPDHFRIVDASAAVGARNVLVVSSDPEPASTAAKLARLSDHARERGLQVSLEFGAFTAVKSLAAALAILDMAGPDLGLLVDSLHLARTGGTSAVLRNVDPRRFAYAQLCDAPATGPDMSDFDAIVHEALDLRLLLGEGALPLAGMLDALPPGLPLSIELRSKALRDAHPDPVERARAVLQSTREALARFDVQLATA